MNFKEIPNIKYNEIFNVLSNFNKCEEEPKVFEWVVNNSKDSIMIGYAYNEDLRAIRVASLAYIRDKKKLKGAKILKSCVFYYDVHENNLKLSRFGKHSYHNFKKYADDFLGITNSSNELNKKVVIETESGLDKLINSIKNNEENTELLIDNVLDLLLVEASHVDEVDPYEEYHTASLRLSYQFDYRADSIRILTLLKDKNGNLKNVKVDTDVRLLGSLEQREIFFRDIKDDLISKIDNIELDIKDNNSKTI